MAVKNDDDDGTESPPIDPNWWKVWRNRRYILAIMAFLGMFNMYSCRVNMGVAIVAMTKSDFTWSSKEKGAILGAFYYGYVVTQVIGGLLTRRISAHIVFGIGTVVPGVLTLFTPLIAEHAPFWVLIGSRVLMGVFQGVAVPCLLAFWTVWGPILERARLHGIAISGAFVGIVIILPLSGYVGQYYGWQWIFYVTGAICIAWYILWVILIKESPQKDPWISDFEVKYIAATIETSTNNKSIPWWKILTSLPVWAVSIAGLTWGWGYVTVLFQLPQYLSDIMDYQISKNGLLSALPYLTMTIMLLIAGYTADKLLIHKILTVTQTRKTFICVSMTIQAAFILAATYIVDPTFNIICITFGIGFGAVTYSGIGVNYIDVAPAYSSIIGGVGNTFTTLSGIWSPLLTGFVVQVSTHFSYLGTNNYKKHHSRLTKPIPKPLPANGGLYF